jgi:hypothetical protein
MTEEVENAVKPMEKYLEQYNIHKHVLNFNPDDEAK